MRVRSAASIGATIFGAFVAMGLLIGGVGGYGIYVFTLPAVLSSISTTGR